MTDWLEPMLREWAAQKRRVWLATDALPTINILQRIREEGAGASHASGRVFQWHPECYTGDGLLVQRAVGTMTDEHKAWVVHVHWIPKSPPPPARPLSVSRKCQMFCSGMAPQRYFEYLDGAYDYLDGWFAAQGLRAGEDPFSAPETFAQKRVFA